MTMIEQYDGTPAIIAGNQDRKRAFIRLGVKVDHDMGLEEALKVSRSNDEVSPVTLYAQTEDNMVEVETHQALFSDLHGVVGIHSPNYEIMQRREILELAYDIAGLSHDEGRIDTIGNIGPHAEKFFAYIRYHDLVIDPGGIADRIERGLYVATSFNGTLKNIIGYSATRIECLNQLSMILKGLTQVIGAKHTRNAEERMRLAAVAQGYVGAVETQLVERAQTMLTVEDGNKALTTLLDHFWPVDDKSLGDLARTRRMRERGDVKLLFEGTGNTNVDKVGRNGWAAYNAVTEYWDHFQGVKGVQGEDIAVRRAERAALPSTLNSHKVKASEIVLEMAG